MGAINKDDRPYGAIRFGRVSGRMAMTFHWDYTGQADLAAYSGVFVSLFGPTDTQVSYDRKTPVTVAFPELHLNLDRVDGVFAEPGGARRYLTAGVSLTYQGVAPVDLRLELKDAAGGERFTRVRLLPSTGPQTVLWDFRKTYTPLAPDLDLTQAKVFSIVVERSNVADGIRNPDAGALILDRLWFTPDRPEVEPASDADLLDLAERRSCQYFVDWSSGKTASLGVPQDRSTFADLLTVGGIGFALPCYAIAAERGWIAREEAARRTLAVLQLAADPSLYCAGPVGCVGYRGWLYHFLGPDGRRKQNFDDPGTPAREDLNTVEVSTPDTVLALAGSLAAQSYFRRGQRGRARHPRSRPAVLRQRRLEFHAGAGASRRPRGPMTGTRLMACPHWPSTRIQDSTARLPTTACRARRALERICSRASRRLCAPPGSAVIGITGSACRMRFTPTR